MIRLELEGTKYHIEWVHLMSEPGEVITPCTICEIYEGDLEEPTWFAGAYLHPNDRYVKETGRKVSLSKALKDWPREKRVEVWKAYFSRKKS